MIFYSLFLHMLYISAAPRKLEEQAPVLLYLYFPEVHIYMLGTRCIDFCFISCSPAFPADAVTLVITNQ